MPNAIYFFRFMWVTQPSLVGASDAALKLDVQPPIIVLG